MWMNNGVKFGLKKSGFMVRKNSITINFFGLGKFLKKSKFIVLSDILKNDLKTPIFVLFKSSPKLHKNPLEKKFF